MGRPVIVAACRTAIGKFQGGLASFTAPQLGGLAVAEALRRSNVPAADVEEVLMGNVLQAGLGQNPARQALRIRRQACACSIAACYPSHRCPIPGPNCWRKRPRGR